MDSTDPNSLSELESLSDSDWLDIASSRASDTDSVAGFDSDRDLDPDDRPCSRRSYNSIGSSRDSDAQGWEGLVDDGADESPSVPLPLTRSTALSSDPAPFDSDLPVEQEDPEEEERVKAALDQSMMSTLSSSASRSGVNSLNGSHSSIVHPRDLRLSFPDPLTSSRDELLNISFENVVASPDADASPSADSDTGVAPTTADPGACTMPEVSEDDDVCEAAINPDFYIVLYGSSSAVKWSLIDKILEKAAHGHDLTLTSKIVGLIDGYVRFLSASGPGQNRAVSVIDRTEIFNPDDAVGSYFSLTWNLTSSCFSRASLL